MSKWDYACLLLLTSVVFFYAGCGLAQGNDGMELYNSAISLFENGDYAAALEKFQALDGLDKDANQDYPFRSGPLHANQVQYNIAACLFKLERLEEARVIFETLTDDESLGYWSLYNRSVIDQKLGDFTRAEAGLWQVISLTDDDDLADLASLQYQKLLAVRSAFSVSTSSRWYGDIGVAYGYDDDLIDPVRLDATNTSDSYLESSLALGWDSAGETGPSWQWDAFILNSQYRDIGTFDLLIANTSVAKNFYSGRWQISGRIGMESSQSGGNDYLRSTFVSITSETERASDDNQWRLAYLYSDITALSDDFEQLQGNTHQAVVEFIAPISEYSQWSIRYQLDYENRMGLQNTIAYYSFSPTRNGIETGWHWGKEGWRHDISVGFRQSRYREDHYLVDNQLTRRIAVRREDDRVKFQARTSYLTRNLWSWFGEWTYFDNQSNLRSYDYQQNNLLLGIRKYF